MAAVKAAVPEIPAAVSELSATKLVYFDDMWALESSAAFLSRFQVEDGRSAVILDSTIFHPQGGGQPADTGSISTPYSEFVFVVEDVRLKDGLVFHYGLFEGGEDGLESKLKEGQKVALHVNGQRRDLNSRLHSAGHLLDICMRNVGLSYLEPGKGYHFPDGPFVEYRGIIPHGQLQNKKDELEKEANALICKGGKVSASILPYEEATKWCGGDLPIYISKSSTPRIVKLGENPGCPCGGTHVADISDIRGLKRIATPAQQKWLLKLLGYDYIVEYRRGSGNKVDALSSWENDDMMAISTLVPSWLEAARHEYNNIF